jgi:ribosomal protein L24
MNPKKQLSRGDKCLQRVIDGKFKGDLWDVMEVIFDESDQFYLQETLIEAKNTFKKFKENEIVTFTDEIHLENIEEVDRAVKKSYQDLRQLQKKYDLGTPERLLIDKEFSEIRKIDTIAIDFIIFGKDKKEYLKYGQV